MAERPAIHDLLPALGHEVLDRRAELRSAGWSAVPGTAWSLVLDPEVATPVSPVAAARTGLCCSLWLRRGPRSRRRAEPGIGRDILLGVDPAGWCGVDESANAETSRSPRSARWSGLREIALRLSADERGILAELVALANWHRTHVRCPRCGAATEMAGLGLVAAPARRTAPSTTRAPTRP